MSGSPTSSIGRRLARINMAASGTALLLAAALLSIYDFRTFRDMTLRARTAQAQIVGANTITALTFDDPSAAESTLAALQAVPRIEAAGLYRPGGELFAEYRRDPEIEPLALPEAPPDAVEWHRFDGLRALHLTYRIVQDGTPLGLVYMRSDLEDARDRVVGYAVIMAGVLLIAMAAAGLVGRSAARAISDPVTELAGLATTLAETRDYSVRATTRAEGELGVLVANFNEMLAQVQARDRKLQEEQALLEQHVRDRTEALQASNQELEAFCYSVSHDLRSPLRSIDGFSQALLEDVGGSLDEMSLDYLKRIRAATQRMGALIDDLLSLSRISRTDLAFKRVDLSAMARTVIDELAAARPDRAVDVVIQPGLEVDGDPRLLRQVFDNLLGNAWKFTGKTEAPRIELGSVARDGATVYFVKDNGAGFDPAYADRLFGVFQRLHAMTEFPGTGVGLAIVDRVLKRHGGRVWADAAVGAGATFYFTFGSPAMRRSTDTSAGS